ncbi:MAG: histone H1 [Rikenellaceae bacterium]
MNELVSKIVAEFASFSENATSQVEKSNKAAGTRARKSSLELEKLLKEFRKESLAASKK